MAFSFASYSQSPVVEYFKKDGTKTIREKKAYFKRAISQKPDKNGLYYIQEFYYNGTLKSQGFLKDKNADSTPHFVGTFESFYENGNLYYKANFKDNSPIDTAFYYHSNGQIWQKIFYDSSHDCPRLIFYADSLAKINVNNGHGHFRFHENGSYEEGDIIDGLRSGTWTGSFLSGRYTFSEEYDNGKLTEGKSQDSLGNSYTYREKEIRPEFPGGESGLSNFIAQHYIYPREALTARISGSVIIDFAVDTSGFPVDFKVKRTLGYGTDYEAIRVIKKIKAWKPGLFRGVPVKVSYSLPIKLNTIDNANRDTFAENLSKIPVEELISTTAKMNTEKIDLPSADAWCKKHGINVDLKKQYGDAAYYKLEDKDALLLFNGGRAKIPFKKNTLKQALNTFMKRLKKVSDTENSYCTIKSINNFNVLILYVPETSVFYYYLIKNDDQSFLNMMIFSESKKNLMGLELGEKILENMQFKL